MERASARLRLRHRIAPAPLSCAACGQPRAGGRCPNALCARADRGWSVVFAVGAHRGGLRQAVVDYKYRRRTWWGPVLARLVAGWLTAHHSWVEDFDLVVPVPTYLGPGARRRWDPVGRVAAEVATVGGGAWEVTAAVVKVAETPAMAGASQRERTAIAEGPLRRSLVLADRAAVGGRRVLVLDDVVTDGATLREVALLLRQGGATEVAGLAVTRSPWGRPAPPTATPPTVTA